MHGSNYNKVYQDKENIAYPAGQLLDERQGW